MHDIPAMKIDHSLHQLPDYRPYLLLQQRLQAITAKIVIQRAAVEQLSHDVDAFFSFDGLLVPQQTGVLHCGQNGDLPLQIIPSVFVAEGSPHVGLDCKFASLPVLGQPDLGVSAPAQQRSQPVVPELLAEVDLGDALVRAYLGLVVERVDAAFAVEEGVGRRLRDAGQQVAVLLVAELDLLEREEVQVGLVHQLQLLVGVAHHSGLLALQRVARDLGVVGVGADLADVGQLHRLAQLHLAPLPPSSHLRLQILVLTPPRLAIAHKIIIFPPSRPLPRAHPLPPQPGQQQPSQRVLYVRQDIAQQFESMGKINFEPQQDRQIAVGTASYMYFSNEVKSTSTNLFTFVPINLMNQLTNLANIYFIIISICQVIPAISVTNGTPTTLVPLSAVMLAVLIKDAYEEYYRYVKDQSENAREVDYLDPATRRFTRKKWEELRVGEVIRIFKEELIPCDAVVIHTSDLEQRCFVETKGLDGETNLKLKNSFLTNPNYKGKITEEAVHYQYQIHCSGRDPYFNSFSGKVTINGQTELGLDHSHLILRGCNLKNVQSVVAAVVFTGKDTKLVQNTCPYEAKKSKLMTEVNKLVFEIFIWQIIIAMVCSLFNTILENSYPEFTHHIPTANFWIMTMTWWLLMTYFIPISLVVTMEMVKLFQGSVLVRDEEGYSAIYDCYTSANNTSVNENLGQIKFVFTDKTGTLTKNNMIFRNLICGGELYGDKASFDKKIDEESEMSEQDPLIEVGLRSSVKINDSRLRSEKVNHHLDEAFRLISLCHEITVEEEKGKLIYNSSSPDELALINFVKAYGRELLGEKNKHIEVAQGHGSKAKIVKYQKLAFIQFNSDRKRMSIFVRNPTNNKIELYCKGADSTMLPLLRKGQKDIETTVKYIDELSNIGLRTLVLAKRTLDESTFKNWNAKFMHAKGLIGEDRKRETAIVSDEIERDMELVGATAIEDELQDDVRDTIRDMQIAGMNFFILTGDKKETAVTIGRSCGLVGNNVTLCHIPTYEQANDHNWRKDMLKLKESNKDKIYLLDASGTIPPELPLHSTICYRCTPSNKEKIVRHVKEHTPYLTMAVGDGANDVNMITAADVGVGIKGREGTQAARVADFVAGEFKFIKLLTLYYGRQWYRKNAKLVTYSFYKNWFHVSSIVAFGAFSYFSGVVIFNVYIYELFNVIYSSWPIIIFAVYDEQYSHEDSNAYSYLYAGGINNEEFNQSVFLKEIGYSIFSGVLSMLVVFYLIEQEVLTQQGTTGYLVLCGSVLLGLIIIIINLKILVISTGIRPINLVMVIASIVSYWVSYAIYAKVVMPAELITVSQTWSCPTIIFVQITLIFFLILIEFGYRKYKEFSFLLENKKKKNEDIDATFKRLILKKEMSSSKGREKQLK